MRNFLTAFLLSLALAFGVGDVVFAQTLTPDQFAESLKRYDSETVAAAKAYAQTFDMRGQFEKAVPAISKALTAQLKGKNPDMTDEQTQLFVDTFMHVALIDNEQVIEQASMILMLEIYSKDELLALNQFYSSPVGAGILKKMPTMMARMPEVMRLMQTYVVPRAVESAREALKARGVEVKI
jgi:hypothetical protein